MEGIRTAAAYDWGCASTDSGLAPLASALSGSDVFLVSIRLLLDRLCLGRISAVFTAEPGDLLLVPVSHDSAVVLVAYPLTLCLGALKGWLLDPIFVASDSPLAVVAD